MLSHFITRAARGVLGVALLASTLSAADVYVVHGIDGTDLGLPQALAVDVNVDGGNAIAGFEFGDVIGPVSLSTGSHELEVRLPDGGAPGTGTLVATARVDLAFAETSVVVAHLDQQGTIALTRFTSNAAPLADGDSRIQIAHAAQAPAVDVLARGTLGTRGALRIRDVRNGFGTFPVETPDGTYTFKVKQTGTKGVAAEFADVPIDGNTVIVAVGSIVSGTFTVVPVVIG